MSWQDRLQVASYTSASSNTRVIFDFVDLSRDTPRRDALFNFARVNDAYVQENGFSARQYPMRCFFAGETHDLEATAFEALLLEKGGGRLDHPLYGNFDVVPFGTIARRNDMVRAANQSIVEVTFYTTIGVVYPSAGVEGLNEIQRRIANFDVEGAQQLDEGLLVKFTTQQKRLRGDVEAKLAQIEATLSKPAEATSTITREFRGWQQTINNSIDTLVGRPLLLAQQFINLVTLPARALIGIQTRILSYAAFSQSIFTSAAGRPWDQPCACSNPRRQVSIANSWYLSDFLAGTSLISMALAATETEFSTKPEAIATADALAQEFDKWVAWRDQGYAALTETSLGAKVQNIDFGNMYRSVQDTVYGAIGYLVSLSFDLGEERVFVLERPRTIIDLTAELYGTVDDRLDFFIETNRITSSEMLEVPQGRAIVWYP